MIDELLQYLDKPGFHAAAIALGSVLLAFVIELVVINALRILSRRTKTTFDDLIVDALQRPVFYSTIFIGLWSASRALELSDTLRYVINGTLKSLAAVLWIAAVLRITSAALKAMSRRAKHNSAVQARTLPIFDILLKVLVLVVAGYLVLAAWGINVSAWVASAGVLGIALGFAAKDSLANLFAGIFIIADAPYKLGDFITLEDGQSGTVTDIGFRSTRILTRNDVEINIPNSLIGNAKVLNETGGPYRKARVAAKVSVAYGSDIDRAHEVLKATTEGLRHVAEKPRPQVLFREFGGSGLEFSVLVWIEEPALREIVLSDLNTRIYKALGEAGIEIPYSKHDIFIKEFPGQARAADERRHDAPAGAKLVAERASDLFKVPADVGDRPLVSDRPSGIFARPVSELPNRKPGGDAG
ncbi:MAG: mechanosensitive ion channel family protein [Nannocystaceae bacterium]|nr:mechanosensitive ion channel family protein [Myxococcales bacterium]